MKWMCLLGLFGSIAMAETVPAPPDGEEAAYPAIERFVQVLESVRTLHPDVDRLTYERLVNHALEGMLASLDPHSAFIHPEMAALMKENAKFDPEVPSLGLSMGVRDNGLYVMNVSPGGAAAKAGVIPGSSVLEINGKPTEGGDYVQMIGALQRTAGTITKLLLKTPNQPRAEELPLTHRLIEHRSVTETRILNKEKGIGYVRLSVFGSGCAREMEGALDELEDAGMKSLILDLRGNGGGDLYETVAMLGLFLPPGTTVVSTHGRKNDEDPMKTPDRQRRKREYPMTVLIDRMSASASELTAGALQDLKRATIVGELSYGKGSVQNLIPMGNGTQLKLTVATYHTPSGRTPHKVGITPDVVVKIDETDRDNFEKKCRLDSLDAVERQKVEAWQDRVLEEALEKGG
jgi:carboxyl-terminal processing protease